MEGAFYLKILLGGFTRPPWGLQERPPPRLFQAEKKGAVTIFDLVQLRCVNT